MPLRKILHVEVAESPSYCERRRIDCFGFAVTLSETAAVFSAVLAFCRRTGVGCLFTEPFDSNLSIKRLMVDSVGRLLLGSSSRKAQNVSRMLH